MQLYRRQLIEVYDTLNRLDDALAQYEQMIGADPQNGELRADRGAIEARLGRAADAEKDYRLAMQLDPSLPEPYLNLALLELADGRDTDAEGHLLRALEIKPDYQKAHFHLARLYAQRGDPRAREHAERAVGAAGDPSGMQ